MNAAKKLFVQSMVISTSILFLNGINAVIQHFAGNDIILQWYHPISIVLTAILCSLPTVLLLDWEQWDRKTLWLRVTLHCLALYAAVAGAGWVFKWYTDMEGFIAVSIIFFVIYVFVWLSSHWLDKQDEKKINRALDEIRDSE
ncbi:MAG: DUF3021 family protein [Clostridia bacterium]|nr:DUF3021 family protein [Clostridia bacterium]